MRGASPIISIAHHPKVEHFERSAAFLLVRNGGSEMIMRVYRCTMVAGKDAVFLETALATTHAWLRQQPGLIAFYAGRPPPGTNSRERFMVQIWENIDAIQAAFGDNWRVPRKLPEEMRALVESASVEHYDIADEFHSIA
jgi:heme-degrading monooxygenase HmoA